MAARLAPTWIAAISAAWLCTTPGAARAESTEAEALFADGVKLVAAGQLAQACEAFEASNRIEPRAGTLIRLGECREQNHQLASAWSAYKDALNRVKDARKREVAAARVAALEPRLSYLTVSIPEDSRVDGLVITRNGAALDLGLWNRAVPVDGGDHVIGGRAPGHEAWRTAVTVPAEGGQVTVDVPRFQELATLVAPIPPVPVTPMPASDEPAPRRGSFTARRKLAIGVAGVGIASVAAGIVLGLQARTRHRDAGALCPDPAAPCAGADQANELDRAGRSRALGADVAFGVAAATAIGAGLLWLTGTPEAPRRRVVAIPSAGGVGLAVTGRF